MCTYLSEIVIPFNKPIPHRKNDTHMQTPIQKHTSSAAWLLKPLPPFRVAVLMASISMPLVFAENVPLYKNADAPVEARVKDLLGRMTTEEKVSQLQCEMAPVLEKEGKPRDYNVGFIRAVGIRSKRIHSSKGT